jgi:predicted  nucleic acid-binding Zn-ribbon protein
MNESIKQLLALQQRDLELDKVRADLASIPAKISGLKTKIETNKSELEAAKKDLNQLQVLKKQKDLDLESREAAIRKHTGELNAVKSNDAYKALLGEIEKAKRDKSALEDEILQIMEQIDQAGKVWKDKESAAKGVQAAFQGEISDLESKQKAMQDSVASKQAERDAAAAAIARPLSEQYDRLRGNKRTNAVVALKNEQCVGCHMKVSQNLINEVRRGQKIMTCEMCSRIVYLEDAPAPQADPSPASPLP